MGFIRGLSCASGREGDDDGREVECVVDGRSQADMAVPLRSECGSEAYNLSPRTMIEGLIRIDVKGMLSCPEPGGKRGTFSAPG